MYIVCTRRLKRPTLDWLTENDDEMVNQAEDTLTILNKFVDGISENNIDNNVLKTLLKELYVEALNSEND